MAAPSAVDVALTSGSGPAITPPNDDEVWSYVAGEGRRFLQFSAFSRVCLGGALVFLSLRGAWLLLLLPFAVAVVVGGLINMMWSTQVPAFDRAHHDALRARAESAGLAPTVDVLICTCGEDPAIVENTIAHAVGLRWRAPVRVHVLDDRGSDEIRRAAARWGATYLSRPDRGWMKKAGNLRYGYERTDGDLILVLDADFAVRPDFLEHTVPYFADEELAILQTPQYFRVSPDNWVERGAAAQQEQFYRVGLRARSAHGGAICVGTNAVYRRSALDERGGMALLEHSEDIFTGMKVVDAGYRVDYLALPLAAGMTPDNTAALASQQYRWARGNFALAGAPLMKRVKLKPMQRLGLWDGWLFYVTSALSPIVAVFVPIVTLAEAPEAITLTPAAMILPALFTEFYLQPRWLFLSDGKASRRVGLVSQVAHLHALRDHLTDRTQEWVPTGGTQQLRRATDRIPDHIAVGAVCGFVTAMTLLVARVMTGWPLIDLAPVGILAAIALPAALGTTRPPVVEHVDAAPTRGIDEGRDSFLDVVRAVSIVRVIFWHALGFWWISWAFAAMPAVFYVSGAVLTKSIRRASCWTVVKRRLRRLVVPFLAFSAISVGLVAIADPDGLRTALPEVVSWVVPYRAPAALPWEGGWLSTPLWFLRALVIVLLLTPVVRPILERVPRTISAVVWLASLVLLDRWVETRDGETMTAVARGVADIVCFGGFFWLGMIGHQLRYRISRAVRIAGAVLFLAGAIAVAMWRPPVDMVVNNSAAIFGLVGLAWLLAMLAVEDQLRALGNIPAIGRFVGWITDNAMTIYLWHTLVLVVVFYLVGAPASLGQYVIFAVVFSALLPIVVIATRPLETLGDRRGVRPKLRLVPIAALVIALAVLATQPTLFPTLDDAVGPPIPSGRPVSTDDDDAVTVTEREAMAVSADAWLQGHRVDGAAFAEIGQDSGGELELGQFGDAEVLDPEAKFEVLSVSKTFVAAAALQLVDEGRLTLDDPLPAVDGVDERITDSLSLRRLLSHATGMRDYRESAGYQQEMSLSAPAAVELGAASADLDSTTSSYAATNYLLVGLVIEAVTDEPLDVVLQERIFDPLGLDDTKLVNNAREGFVGHASGGVVSTLPDIARWYDSLMRQRSVLSDEMLHEMLWGGIDYQQSAGLGAWRHCPCDPPTPERPEPFLYVSHDGGDVRVLYIPSRDTVLVIRLSEPLYGPTQLVGDIDDLVFAVSDRRAIADRQLAGSGS